MIEEVLRNFGCLGLKMDPTLKRYNQESSRDKFQLFPVLGFVRNKVNFVQKTTVLVCF